MLNLCMNGIIMATSMAQVHMQAMKATPGALARPVVTDGVDRHVQS